MKQFWKICKFELKNYMVNKVFVGITLLLVAGIAVVMFFPRIGEAFHSDEPSGGAAAEEKPVMLVAGKEADTAGVDTAFAAAFPNYEVRRTNAAPDEIKRQITGGEAECAFVMESPVSYAYYVNNLSLYDANTAAADEVLQSTYRLNAMVQSGIPAEQAQKILTAQIHHTVETLGKDQAKNFFYAYVMIFALYMVILLYGQMVAMNVASEKSSRAMELLITSAKPVSMMFGKVIASCLAGLIQLTAIFGTAMLTFNLNKTYWEDNAVVASLFDVPPQMLGYMLVFFILGFFIYAFMFGAVGSTASKLEDINTSSMPITMLFVVAFLVVMLSLANGSVDNMAMKVCSYIPFTSPMAMFTRIVMSTVPWYEIAVSIAILAGSVVGVGVLSAKIYRVGVLLYGTSPKLSSILKSIWKA